MLRMILAMGLTRWRYIGLWASVLLTLACVAVLATKGLALGLNAVQISTFLTDYS
ncbi:hypothetical protein ACK3Z8_13410 [Aeromonas caviae]